MSDDSNNEQNGYEGLEPYADIIAPSSQTTAKAKQVEGEEEEKVVDLESLSPEEREYLYALKKYESNINHQIKVYKFLESWNQDPATKEFAELVVANLTGPRGKNLGNALDASIGLNKKVGKDGDQVKTLNARSFAIHLESAIQSIGVKQKLILAEIGGKDVKSTDLAILIDFMISVFNRRYVRSKSAELRELEASDPSERRPILTFSNEEKGGKKTKDADIGLVTANVWEKNIKEAMTSINPTPSGAVQAKRREVLRSNKNRDQDSKRYKWTNFWNITANFTVNKFAVGLTSMFDNFRFSLPVLYTGWPSFFELGSLGAKGDVKRISEKTPKETFIAKYGEEVYKEKFEQFEAKYSISPEAQQFLDKMAEKQESSEEKKTKEEKQVSKLEKSLEKVNQSIDAITERMSSGKGNTIKSLSRLTALEAERAEIEKEIKNIKEGNSNKKDTGTKEKPKGKGFIKIAFTLLGVGTVAFLGLKKADLNSEYNQAQQSHTDSVKSADKQWSNWVTIRTHYRGTEDFSKLSEVGNAYDLLKDGEIDNALYGLIEKVSKDIEAGNEPNKADLEKMLNLVTKLKHETASIEVKEAETYYVNAELGKEGKFTNRFEPKVIDGNWQDSVGTRSTNSQELAQKTKKENWKVAVTESLENTTATREV